MREVVSLVSGVTVSPDVPGYLELSREKLDRLIIREPLEKYYDVEEEPFARGKSAAVRRCVERNSGRQYAAKFLKKRRRSNEIRPETLHEVAVLEACRGCHRVVSIHQVYESPAETVLILELACGGELQTLLDSDEVPSEGQVVRLMKQILDGIVYLHSINVAHLDLKPQNLVLTGEYPSCDVKLCDFGISRYLSQGADVREILGTPDYVAPEVLNYEPISLATDMWSVGVLMYVLLTGCSPFGGDTKQETFCNITQCRLDFPDELFEDISQEAQDLMTKLMVMKPGDRLCAKECLQHPWFTKEFSSVPSTPKSMTPLQRTPVPMRRETNIRQPELSSTTETLLPISSSEENDNVSTNMFIERKTSFRESSSEKLDNKVHLDNEKHLDNVPCRNTEIELDNKADKEKEATDDTTKPPEVKVTRVESFRSMVRANGMQTMPVAGVTRYHHMQNINREPNRETLFKFKQIYITDDMDESPPASISGSSSGSSISADTTFNSDSNSDTVSDMSIDSSSDRSSIISLDDSLDFSSGKGLSHYRYYSSSCFNVWEVSRPQKPWTKTIRECSGTYARARSIFSKLTEDGREGQFLRDSKLAVFNSNNNKLAPPQTSVANKSIALELKKEQNSNIVTIKEVKPVRGKRYTRTSEVRCETVKSRIRKLEVYSEKSGEFVKEFKHDVF